MEEAMAKIEGNGEKVAKRETTNYSQGRTSLSPIYYYLVMKANILEGLGVKVASNRIQFGSLLN